MFFNCIRTTVKCLQRVNQSRISCITPVTQKQRYGDWYHRQPVKILNEEEILHAEEAEEATGPNEFTDVSNVKDVKSSRKALKARPKKMQIKKKLQSTPNDVTFKEDGSLNITELKEDDQILLTLMMSVRSKKKRLKNDRIILEGSRLIVDAINSGIAPEIIVFSRTPDAMMLPLPEKGVKLFKVPYRAIQMWSTLVTPPGIMGFFRIPNVEHIKPPADAVPLTIICDNVRDPRNLGSILRAAAAVGCRKLITLVGCVDIWDPKVLKCAAGSHFRTPILALKTWDDIPKLINPTANFYVADNSILVDHEDTNDTDESSELANDKDINTEIHSGNEIFNETYVNMDTMEEEDEENDEHPKKEKTFYQRIVESKTAKKITSSIPVIPYYSADYTKNENVIIIGGETLGLSLEALKMVNDNYGVRVNIPMTNGVESLNTGMALGIIAFEVRRQLAKALNEEK